MRKLVVTLVAVLCLSGCPVSKDPYTASMQASLSVSDGVAQAIPIINQLSASGEITLEEQKAAANYLTSATIGNQVFRHTVQSLHAQGQKGVAGYLAAADVFVKGVNSQQTLAAIHISNPKSQQKVLLYLNAVDTVLTGIQTAIQNNSVTPTPAPVPTGAYLWTLSPSLI